MRALPTIATPQADAPEPTWCDALRVVACRRCRTIYSFGDLPERCPKCRRREVQRG